MLNVMLSMREVNSLVSACFSKVQTHQVFFKPDESYSMWGYIYVAIFSDGAEDEHSLDRVGEEKVKVKVIMYQ